MSWPRGHSAAGRIRSIEKKQWHREQSPRPEEEIYFLSLSEWLLNISSYHKIYLRVDVRMPLVIGSALTGLVGKCALYTFTVLLSFSFLFTSQPIVLRALQCCVAMATPFDTVLNSLLHYHRIINFYVAAPLGTAAMFASGLCDVSSRFHLVLLFRFHLMLLTQLSVESPILRALLWHSCGLICCYLQNVSK
jgi:hypothetical protein